MISLIVEELPSGKILATGIPIVSPSPKFELNKAWSLDVTVPAAALASGLALDVLREWGCACWVDNGTQIVAGGIPPSPAKETCGWSAGGSSPTLSAKHGTHHATTEYTCQCIKQCA